MTTKPNGLSWPAITALITLLAFGGATVTAVAMSHSSALLQIQTGVSQIQADLKTALKAIDAAEGERDELRRDLSGHDRRITTLEATAPKRAPP